MLRHTWSRRFRGKFVQYVTSHFKIVPSYTERSNHSVLRESESRQLGNVFDVDVLVCRGFGLSRTGRIVLTSHQGGQSSCIRFQINVPHDVLSRTGYHDRVLVMMILSIMFFASFRWSGDRERRRNGWHVAAGCCLTGRRGRATGTTRFFR